MFARSFLSLAVATLSLVASASACQSDSDCAGNLDCTRVTPFKRACLPVSCAKGAAQAILDSGFVPRNYVRSIQRRSNLRNGDLFSLSGGESQSLAEAMTENPPPKEVFEANYTACVNPKSDEEDAEPEQTFSETLTGYGLQWSAAALFSYFGTYNFLNISAS